MFQAKFAKRIKTALGAMAKGRTFRGIKDGFELRESHSDCLRQYVNAQIERVVKKVLQKSRRILA